MKALEHLRVVGRRKHSANRCKVGPHGDCKAIMHKDAWLDSRVESSNRAVVLCEPFHNFNFRRQPRFIRLPAEPTRPGSHRCQSLSRRDPRNDIAWHQADDKAVGVVENDRGVERRGGRPRCSHRTPRYRCLHLRVPSSTRDPHGCITLHRRRRSAVSVTNSPPLGSPRSSCAHRWPPPWAEQTELEGRPSRWLVVDSPRRYAQAYGSEGRAPRARCPGQSEIVCVFAGLHSA